MKANAGISSLIRSISTLFVTTALLLTCNSATQAATTLNDWIKQQRAFVCFPWLASSSQPPAPTVLPHGLAIPSLGQESLFDQMSGHGSELDHGAYAMYDPVHHIAIGSILVSEDLGVDFILTDVTSPPRSIAWRDLSHFNPGGHRVIGLSLEQITARYGHGAPISACGLQAITYSPRDWYGYVGTFIVQNDIVVGYVTSSP